MIRSSKRRYHKGILGCTERQRRERKYHEGIPRYAKKRILGKEDMRMVKVVVVAVVAVVIGVVAAIVKKNK